MLQPTPVAMHFVFKNLIKIIIIELVKLNEIWLNTEYSLTIYLYAIIIRFTNGAVTVQVAILYYVVFDFDNIC